jgi:hypothetical protein
MGGTMPLEALAADTDAVADGQAIALDKIEELVLGIDDDGARLFLGVLVDFLPVELPWHFFDRDARQLVARIGHSAVVVGEDLPANGAATGDGRGQRQCGNYCKRLHAHEMIRSPAQRSAARVDRFLAIIHAGICFACQAHDAYMRGLTRW